MRLQPHEFEPWRGSRSSPLAPPDPRALFGDIRGVIPSPKEVVDSSAVIAQGLQEGQGVRPEYDTPLEQHPYAPDPKAVVKDRVVTYSESNPQAIRAVTAIRREVSATTRALSRQMRMSLAAHSMSRIERDQTSGLLDRRKLHTLNLPGRVRAAPRVFQRHVPGISTNIAVGVMIDQSGSMQGDDKMVHAKRALVALGDALAGLSSIGVKFAVWGFDSVPLFKTADECTPCTDRSDYLRLHRYKDFSENWRRVAPRVGHVKPLSDNVDGESIRWGAQELLHLSGVDRRILIVLSDGMPVAINSYYRPRDPHCFNRLALDLRNAVDEIQVSGVEVFGVGLCTDAVAQFYPNHIVIFEASDLELKLVSLIHRAFVRRVR